MAGPAEVYEVAPKIQEVEEYGRSLVAMRHAGHLIVESNVTIEAVREETELYHEYRTAVKEMLKNDPEHHGALELSNCREHKIIDGQTVNAKGEPMVDVLQNGVVASKQLLEQDVDYSHQVVRDMCDVALAERVDDMPAGTTIWGVSKEPAEALEKRPDIYHKQFGYKKGLVYIQTYSKTDEETLVTGSYSVEYTDIDMLLALLAKRGIIIPRGESDDTWLNHAQISNMTADEANEFALELRQEHNKAEGIVQSFSVEEFMDEHEAILYSIFDKYYPAIAEATITHSNNDLLMDLASALLQGNSTSLRPEIRQQLLVLNNSRKFNDESAKVLDSILRYATVEELRKYLPMSKQAPQTKTSHQTMHAGVQSGYEADMSMRVAQNVYTGVEAGRSYPGCPGNIQLGNDESNTTDSDGINRQEAFGGKAEADADCEFVSKTCPECGSKNVKTKVSKIKGTNKKHISGDCGCSITVKGDN